MAAFSDSWFFPVPASDIPQRPLNANNPACGGELNRYITTYCNADGTRSSSRGAFIEHWIDEHRAELPGLDYMNRTCAVLDRDAIRAALDGIEAAFRVIATLPRDLAERWSSGLTAAEMLAASDDVVDQYVSEDCEDPFYLILHLRRHRRVLGRALETHGYAMYLLFNPYSDDADESTWAASA